jgi:hypothetical protein
MKILHQEGFTPTELLTNRQIIYRNLIDSAKALVQFLKDFDILPANPEIFVRPRGTLLTAAGKAIHHELYYGRRLERRPGLRNISLRRCVMAR